MVEPSSSLSIDRLGRFDKAGILTKQSENLTAENEMPPAILNALRVFSTVVEHGNIQRAAEVLNLSRGAVSQRIK